MSLLSLPFIGFIILFTGLYFLVPGKLQWVVLLLASAIFYLAGGWQGIIYILITIATQYFLALELERKNAEMNVCLAQEGLTGAQKRKIKEIYGKRKRIFVLLAVGINLGILIGVKYLDPLLGELNSLFALSFRHVDILIPLGLSYYTFKSIGYVLDVSHGRIPAQRNIFKLGLYIGYFPALVQGPIDRYEAVAEQLFVEHRFDYDRLCFGAQRMLWGYIKKMVIAERAAVLIDTVQGSFAAAGYEGFTIFFAMVLGVFRLYADFSGGMDIVLGLSEIYGIKLTENFKRPFLSRSIAEYWQRWHITLGAWMRTYVFYPLSLSKKFNRLGKKCREKFGDRYGKLVAPSLASFITFFLVGMWHGVGWAYLPFSLYHATLVAQGTLLSEFYDECRTRLKVKEDSKCWHVFQVLRTFFLVIVGNYLVLSEKPDMVGLIKATFQRFNPWVFFDGTFYKLGLEKSNFWLLMISIGVLIAVDLLQERGIGIRKTIVGQKTLVRWCIYYTAIFTLLLFAMYGSGSNADEFIYMRF